ncbi:vWA domain-containing protein [Streptomyces sp. HUCO-GS316]|uniref:vWA domain-containing protein n=1 Tax=Streptomyces sp. HUCO-GS316 TaxID=2692198 RepID=UPI001F43EFC7|nr:VWA domain-containing protein [Streptomyces sp. HUCO-GS316]
MDSRGDPAADRAPDSAAKVVGGLEEPRLEGGRRSSAHDAELYQLRHTCQPTYIVIDASSSMQPHQNTLNRTLAQLHATISESPRVSEFAHMSLIAFSTDAHLIIEMTALDRIQAMPEVVCNGLTNYSAAFDLVRTRIETDVDDLRSMGMAVLRPVMFLLTDGAPTDQGWHDAFRRLVNRSWPRYPHVISYGFGAANPDVLGKVATKAAFLADAGIDQDRALLQALGSLLNSLVASARAEETRIPRSTPGFTGQPVSEEYLTVPADHMD